MRPGLHLNRPAARAIAHRERLRSGRRDGVGVGAAEHHVADRAVSVQKNRPRGGDHRAEARGVAGAVGLAGRPVRGGGPVAAGIHIPLRKQSGRRDRQRDEATRFAKRISLAGCRVAHRQRANAGAEDRTRILDDVIRAGGAKRVRGPLGIECERAAVDGQAAGRGDYRQVVRRRAELPDQRRAARRGERAQRD